jgi:DNA-binding FadR family transcriptional regulator
LMWQGNVTVKDLTEARASIEPLIMAKVFDGLTEDTLDELETSVQALEVLAAADGEAEYQVDPTLTGFHMLLANATGNPIYPIILKVLLEMTRRVVHLSTVHRDRLRTHAISHRRVVNALKERDLEAALRAMEEHMMEVGSRYASQAHTGTSFKNRTNVDQGVQRPKARQKSTKAPPDGNR